MRVQYYSDSNSAVDGVPVSTLPDKLKCPMPSALSRQIKVLSNPPPVGKKRSTGARGKNDPGVHTSKRVSVCF